jgi:outer membrane protein TolC
MYLVDAPSYNIEGREGFDIADNVAPVDLTKFHKITSEEDDKTPEAVSDAKFTSNVEKLELLSDYNVEKFPYSFDECLKMAKKNRSDLKAYELTVKAMEENLKLIKRNYYPDITANAGYGLRNASNISATNTFNAGVGISSSLNIMAQKNQVDAGKYQVQMAKNTLDQLEKDIYFQVQNAYILMTQAQKQIPLHAVKVRQTRENYELAEGRYYVGLGDYIELQDAKVNYNNAQHSYVESIYNYNVARANLESVIAMPQQVTKTLEGKKNGRKK